MALSGSLLLLNGCLVAAVGAGVGAVKYGKAKQKEAATMQKSAYSDYVIEQQKINTDREKNGLSPEKIMTFDEWDNLTSHDFSTGVGKKN